MILQLVPPSDKQLDLIRSLCDERGFPMPPVHSMTEASLIINELFRREYRPPEFSRYDETDADREAEWFDRIRYEEQGFADYTEHPS